MIPWSLLVCGTVYVLCVCECLCGRCLQHWTDPAVRDVFCVSVCVSVCVCVVVWLCGCACVFVSVYLCVCSIGLTLAVGDMFRKVHNPRAFKTHVSPHELLQAVTAESKKQFKLTQQVSVCTCRYVDVTE